MSSRLTNFRLWLRTALVTGLALGAATFVTSAVLSKSISAGIEWGLFVAALGGALGSLQYRAALAIPALSRHSLVTWLLSTAWATPLLLAALKAGEPHAQSGAPFFFKLAAILGLAAVMSLMSFMPLRWLRGVEHRRDAP